MAPFLPPSTPHAKATLRHVADLVGVSVATVSRALSRPEMVSPALRQRIDACCRDLSYIPNHTARSLTLARSHSIGLVVPTIANPIFSPLIESLQAQLEPRGYGLLIHCCHRDAVRERRQCEALIERGVDAVILGNPLHDMALFDILQRFRMPYLCVAGSMHGRERPSLTYDSGAAIIIAIDRLMALGHRAIAVLSGPGDTTPIIADRLAAARQRLAAHAILPPAEWDVECGYAAAEARRGAAMLLACRKRPTAILCTGDLHALAAIAECNEHGVRVPQDMSIIGCNDMEVAQFTSPALTTVRTPYADMGRHAAELILAMIANQPAPAQTLLPSTLLERQSLAAPRR